MLLAQCLFLVLTTSASALAVGASASARLPVVYPLPDIASFESELASAKDAGSLMVIKYARPNCRSCLALAPKFEAMAKNQPHRRLFEVNERAPPGRKLCASNKIESLPTAAVYLDGELMLQKVIKVKEWDEFLAEIDNLDADANGI